MMTQSAVLVGLEAVTKAASVELRINDVPAVRFGSAGSERAFIPVPASIVRGANHMAAQLVQASPPGGEMPHVSIRIAVFRDGDMHHTEAGHELARMDWAGQGGRAFLQADFTADFGPRQWSWARCQTWTDPQAALTDALPFIGRLLQAYYQNDIAWFAEESQPNHADMVTVFPYLTLEMVREQTASAMSDTGVQPVPANPPLPMPMLCANGKLLLLRAHDGQPYLRKPGAGGGIASLDCMLGKLNGAWKLVR